MIQIVRPAALTRAFASSARPLATSQLPTATSTWSARYLTTETTTQPTTEPLSTPRVPNSPNNSRPELLCYRVGRTFSNNLPVYEKKSRSNPQTQQWTQIRRIDGGSDGLAQLKKQLEEHLGFDLTAIEAAKAAAATASKESAPRVRPPRQKRKDRERKKGAESIKINPVTSHLIIPGRHKAEVISFLTARGF